MIEVRSMHVENFHFIGIYMNLPQYPIHLILSTHTILAQNNFSITFFESNDKRIAVILCEYVFGFDGLLNSVVVERNTIAEKKGVEKGMYAREALMLCEEN